jgi:Fe-S-cluster containining protein
MDEKPEPVAETGTVTAHVGLSIAGTLVRTDITVPLKAVKVGDLLPVLQSLDDLVVRTTVESVENEGRTISCRKGCGACCRQLVPIAEPEARRIRDLVGALPEPRRSTVRARFAEAHRRLEQAGLLETLRHPDQWATDAFNPLGLEYFAQHIACPFLEEESCSIHPDRPLACREYLVTSPAANCAQPSAETIERVKMPKSVWSAVARLDPVAPSDRFIRWVPLILALEWAEAHHEEPPERPAPEILCTLLEQLTGTTVEPPKPASADGV